MGSASKTPHMQGGFASLFDATPAQCVKVPDAVPYAGGGARRAARRQPARGRARRRHRRQERHPVRRRADRPSDHARRQAEGLRRRHGRRHCRSAARLRRAAGRGQDDRSLRRRRRAEGARRESTFDVAFEISGTAAGLAAAIASVRRGGTVVQVGNLPGGQIPVPANAVMAKEIDLKGTFRFGAEFNQAVDLIVGGEVDVLKLVTAEKALSSAPDAFRLAPTAREASR